MNFHLMIDFENQFMFLNQQWYPISFQFFFHNLIHF